jgi:hypothetical protein
MKEPLIPNILEQQDAVMTEWHNYDSTIVDRCTYIFKQLAKTCGFKFRTWQVAGSEEHYYGDVNTLWTRTGINTKEVDFKDKSGTWYAPYTRIIINGKTVDAMKRIPKRWLFENFEQELKMARQLYVDKQKRKTAALTHARQKIKQKLSTKELKILGLSI